MLRYIFEFLNYHSLFLSHFNSIKKAIIKFNKISQQPKKLFILFIIKFIKLKSYGFSCIKFTKNKKSKINISKLAFFISTKIIQHQLFLVLVFRCNLHTLNKLYEVFL